MSLITYLIALAVTGLLVGALARLSLPGRDPLSISRTILLGVVASFIAGLITYAVLGRPHGAGIVLSVLCGSVLMYFVRRSRGGGLLDPGGRGHREPGRRS